tara:strand:- start:1709 stop:2629 length:921 start_codon:yes stop_codon:yes gene_type:complete
MSIDKLAVFGDSFSFGSELYQDVMGREQVIEHLQRHAKTKLRINANDSIDKSDVSRILYEEWYNIESDKESFCHARSFGGHISNHFNIEYDNYSFPGYSIEAIYSEILIALRHNKINDSSFVIVGLTYPGRTIKYNTNKCGTRYCTEVNSTNVSIDSEHEKYMMLNFKYGSDFMSEFVKMHGYINSIKNILEQHHIKFMIVDPVSVFLSHYSEQGKYVNDAVREFVHGIEPAGDHNHIYREELIDQIQIDMKSIIFAKTMRDVEQDLLHLKEPSRALLGHFNSKAHALYATDYLIPHIEETILCRH